MVCLPNLFQSLSQCSSVPSSVTNWLNVIRFLMLFNFGLALMGVSTCLASWPCTVKLVHNISLGVWAWPGNFIVEVKAGKKHPDSVSSRTKPRSCRPIVGLGLVAIRQTSFSKAASEMRFILIGPTTSTDAGPAQTMALIFSASYCCLLYLNMKAEWN